MTRMTYAEQLKHPKWQRRRLEILERARFKCESCDDGEKTLHVHHKRYRKGAMAWDYPDTELVALCEDCHASETLLRQQLDDAIGKLGIGDLETLVGFAEAMHAVDEVFGDHDENYETAEKWSFRSFEHAWGFLARALAYLPTQFVYEVIREEPLTGGDIFVLGRDAKQTLRDAWDRAAESRRQAVAKATNESTH